MSEEKVPRFVRFDFPPGAGPEEIAKAIREAGDRLLRERRKEEEVRKANDTSPKTS